MVITSVFFKDSLGRECTVRNAVPSDAGMLIQYLRQTAAESPFLLREPDETDMTESSEVLFIEKILNNPREAMLVVFVDGKHAGNCSLMQISPFRRQRHRCEIAVALYKEYWGAGIGKSILRVLLREAAGIGYEQAELDVAAENDRAIALYRGLGFEAYGRFPNNMKYADGTYADTVWMMKKL